MNRGKKIALSELHGGNLVQSMHMTWHSELGVCSPVRDVDLYSIVTVELQWGIAPVR